MKKYLFKLLISFKMLFFCINVCNADPYVANPSTNSTFARGLCKYYVSGSTATSWNIDRTSCVKTFSDGRIDPNGFNSFSEVLYVKWKNIERNADTQIIFATYGLLDKPTEFTEVGPFTLDMPKPIFSSGSAYNIPCYVNTSIPIDLNPYINTTDNGIDKGEEITSHFEWTLPSGWRTTEGQTGTFISTSSISVIPPVSSSPVSISVRAKANTQYSSVATLQITRNLPDFTIEGEPTVDCNSTKTYSVPMILGATYTWQNQSGWIGQSTTNFINVTAQNTPTCILRCTISVCGQSKSAERTISANLFNPLTSITGPSVICSSGEVFTIANLAPMNFIGWTCSSNLMIISGNYMSSTCTVKRIGAGTGWVKAELIPKCGGDFFVQKDITDLGTASISGSTTIPLEGTGSWTASVSGCGPFRYEWLLREVTSSPNDAVLIGEGCTLNLVSVQRGLKSANKYQNTLGQGSLQSLIFTNYYLYVRVFDIFGNTYTSPDWHIHAEGEVDLININQSAIKATSENINTSTLELNISPNPSTDETSLAINNTESNKQDENIEWQLEIYDSMQSLKTKIQKIHGIKQTIRTTGWKEGIYVVRAKVGNDVIIEKLMVK